MVESIGMRQKYKMWLEVSVCVGIKNVVGSIAMRLKCKMLYEASVSVKNIKCGEKYRYAPQISNGVEIIDMHRKYKM